ncbi:unnamed protein product [Rotaria sordida]|uniref:Carboxylesterase type B domain-containing protein n=1 Tax=Rotaria sordida TaxID=392033 RepID=A0A819ENU2_9BILA|nr:unnamed protein product [Rotaria sordida]
MTIHFKIIAYNIFEGGVDTSNPTGNEHSFNRLTAIAAFLRSLNPTLVVLTELNGFDSVRFSDFANQWNHQYTAFLNASTGFHLGISSLFPLIELAQVKHDMHHGALLVQVNFNDEIKIGLVATHLNPSTASARTIEAKMIIDQIKKQDLKDWIIAGDLNSLSEHDAAYYQPSTKFSGTNKLRTQKGIIYGRQTHHSIEYLGIRYAKIIRWKPPIDLASEPFPNGSFHATSFGPCCPQATSPIYIPKQDEQCLYLNIYKPIVSSNHSLLPVFVWIHGGGHRRGCSSQNIPLLYNGTNMIAHSPADQTVIVITINYRLGVLADMYLKELIEENPEWPTAGNYMYLDMLSALRWIKKNIQDYGGDPNNIALFGESAGGLSVIDLGAIKGSVNLYRTAISQSGLGSPGAYSSYYNMSHALNYSNSVVQQLNCANDDQDKVLLCLRNSSIEDLLTAYGNRYTRPIIDNYFFPRYPPLAIKNGMYNKDLSLIMGNNDDEIAVCYAYPDINFNETIALLSQYVEEKWISRIVDYFHLKNCSSNRTADMNRCCAITRLILIDNLFDCNVHRLYDALYLKYGSELEQNKLFWYHLNCHPECAVRRYKGVCVHTAELPYVFGTVSDYLSVEPANCTWDNSSRIFSNEIISYWIKIAATGRPFSQWPNYVPFTREYFYITPDQNFSPMTWNRNCLIFDQIEEQGVKEKFGNSSHTFKETFLIIKIFFVVEFFPGIIRICIDERGDNSLGPLQTPMSSTLGILNESSLLEAKNPIDGKFSISDGSRQYSGYLDFELDRSFLNGQNIIGFQYGSCGYSTARLFQFDQELISRYRVKSA